MATTTKKLYLVWGLDNGKNLTLTLAMPKDDLTADDVAPVMQLCVDKDAFRVGTAKAETLKDAYVRQVTTTDIGVEASD